MSEAKLYPDLRCENDRLRDLNETLYDACKDIESKIVDYVAGKINWRPDDFLHRVRKAIAKHEGEL